jgi:uncharacterized membrane protein (UPF0127 family)
MGDRGRERWAAGKDFAARRRRAAVRVVHEPRGDRRVLASEVETADSLVSQGLGLMFRRSIPEKYALVFRFGRQKQRSLHMVFVPFAIDALWLADGVVQQVRTLSPWTGHGRAVADTVIELPEGAADHVDPGDRVVVEANDAGHAND